MTTRAFLLPVVILGLAGCGGGGGKGSQGPVIPGERNAVAQLKYCFEGAGAVTAAPEKTIPELGNAPGAPDLKDAKRVLVVAWADTKHAANVYYAATDAAAASAAGGAGGRGVQQKGQVVVVPDGGSPPNSDEALLISDCLP